MGTIVTMEVVHPATSTDQSLDRAFGWFREIEARCTRFDPNSELMLLTAQAGTPVPASDILYEAVRFAIMVAEESEGAFDPTIGHHMESRGFNREHRTGAVIQTSLAEDNSTNYRDIRLDPKRRTITLLRPLTLDLGAVAKGLAVDAAARELAPHRDFAIDAGGDLYLGGFNRDGGPWSIGIRHPRRDGALIDRLAASDQAVCTSGDYEKPNHILDPRSGTPSRSVASATVVASSAMLADALATAAFVMGPREGIQMLEDMEVEGLIITPSLERYETRGLRRAA